jgi:predicted dehydrogenase
VEIDRRGPDWVVGKLFGARGAAAHVEPLPIPERLIQGLNLSDPRRVPGEFLFSNLTRRFADAIRTGGQAVPGFREGLEAQKVVEAVLASAEEQKWVSVA